MMKTAEERKEERRERWIQKCMQDCCHFTGIQNTCCAAGVNLRQLVGGPDFGWAVRIPCLPSMDKDTIAVSCDKFKTLTREEAIAQIEHEEERSARTLFALTAAHKDAETRGLGKGNGATGEVKCPCCDSGTIRYAVASYNGHMHAACSTEGCVQWME